MQVEMWALDQIKPYEKNPRINDDAVAAVAKSLEAYGVRQPIVVDCDGVIIVGHTRWKAAKLIGLEKVPVHIARDLEPEAVRAYRIADNKTAELSEWDFDLLPIELQELADVNYDLGMLGFSKEELAKLLDPGVVDGLTDPDEVPEPPDEPIAKPGDLWILGNHRLLCGDATKPEDVQRLTNGRQVDLWITDPPYNVDYTGKTKDALKVANDSMADQEFRDFLVKAFTNAFSVTKPGGGFYIWHADSEGFNFRGAVHDCGQRVRQCLIWNKNVMVMGRQDYHWQHEPCQPPGTMVRTPNACVPIETLRDGDRVVSYDSYSGVITGMRDGLAVKVASRQYEGKLYGVCVAGHQTWTTDSHRFTVRLRGESKAVRQVAACNLVPEIMEVPVPYETQDPKTGKSFDWCPITAIDVKANGGPVFSLDVERDHHYIADGIVTHNCLYGWKDGASHSWFADRKQTTILNFDRPSRSEIHPTMKPVAMFVYLLQNSSSANSTILDTFAGSGTTLIAAEQTGRSAMLMEIDPAYADVICERYQSFTGKPAVLERTGDSPIPMKVPEEAAR